LDPQKGLINHAQLKKRDAHMSSGNTFVFRSGACFLGNNKCFHKLGVRGTVILGAVPQLDATKQTLSFRNVDFAADTKSTLKGTAMESAAWLRNPLIVSRGGKETGDRFFASAQD
jgi:hypothetical protein